MTPDRYALKGSESILFAIPKTHKKTRIGGKMVNEQIQGHVLTVCLQALFADTFSNSLEQDQA